MEPTAEFVDAIRKGDVARVRESIRANPALANARGRTGASMVLLATYLHRKAVVDALVAGGAVLDVHDAAAIGDLETVKELVERDRSLVNATSAEGYPPLGLAAFLGHTNVVEFLLREGADVNAVGKNENGFTALTGAVAGGHADVVELLVDRGADVNQRYEGGTFSPLLAAAAEGDPRIVRLLLDHGANANTRTADGKTALALALEKGHREVADVLRCHGGKE
jgi:ankyrin repeat protein